MEGQTGLLRAQRRSPLRDSTQKGQGRGSVTQSKSKLASCAHTQQHSETGQRAGAWWGWATYLVGRLVLGYLVHAQPGFWKCQGQAWLVEVGSAGLLSFPG